MHNVITKVAPKNNLIIIATFADGEVVSFDIKTLFDKYPIFKKLKDNELFNSVNIDGIGYGISWNNNIDLSSDGIYLQGTHIDNIGPEYRIVVGLNLAAAREKMGMSQRELSSYSGVMQAEISKIEQGKGNPTITTLQKLAKTLKITIASLFLFQKV